MRWKKNKAVKKFEYTKWFAWYPVETLDNQMVWLEWIWRLEAGHYNGTPLYNYRLEYVNMSREVITDK
jgi:hypothetical protein